MTVFTDRRERTRFFKFIAVGAIGFIIDIGLANLLSHFLGMWLVLAGTISFTCAVISNFIWNRYWTYPDSRSRPLAHQLVMFFVVNVAGLAIRVPILWFLEPPMRSFFASQPMNSPLAPANMARIFTLLAIRVPSLRSLEPLLRNIFTPGTLALNFTLMVAVTVVLLWNFFINRYWTYNDVDQGKIPARG